MNLTGLDEDDKIKIAEKAGWTCTCFSPLTLEDDDGNYAVGLAARYALDGIVEDFDESELDEYLYEVKIFTKQGYIPEKIKRLSDGTLLTLNEPYVDGVHTYSFSIDLGMGKSFRANNYTWEEGMKLYNPLDFRVISWIKPNNE